MFQNYVVEIQKNHNGEYGHNVFWLYDEDADRAMLKAESKYHEVLAAAAISEVAEHAAILFTSEGFPKMHQCYKHAAAPAPAPEEPGNPGGEEPGEA